MLLTHDERRDLDRAGRQALRELRRPLLAGLRDGQLVPLTVPPEHEEWAEDWVEARRKRRETLHDVGAALPKVARLAASIIRSAADGKLTAQEIADIMSELEDIAGG